MMRNVAEQPMFGQALFILDRVKALARNTRKSRTKGPFASLLKGQAARRFDRTSIIEGGWLRNGF